MVLTAATAIMGKIYREQKKRASQRGAVSGHRRLLFYLVHTVKLAEF
jgi:hypothetical protein